MDGEFKQKPPRLATQNSVLARLGRGV